MPEKELINPKKIGILLGAVALDGIVSLIGLVSISKDPTNIWILGLSKTRFALAAAIALFSLVFIVLALKSRLDKGWSRKIIHRGLDAFNSTRLAAFIFAFALLGIGAGIFTSFALIFSANAFERVYLIRLAPLIFLETMIAVKLLLLLAKHSSGWRTVEQNLCSRIEKSSTQGSSFRVGDAGWKNIISLLAVVLLIAIVFGVRSEMGTFIIDDAWITFRYAKNLASGQGLSWEAAAPTPTEGYSNLLEVLYIAAAIRADISPVFVARAIGLISMITIISVAFVQLVTVTGNLWIALIPLTLYTLHPFTAIHTWAGLETQLFVALNVLILFVFWRSLADEQPAKTLVTTLPRGNADHNAPRSWPGNAERLNKRSNAERRNEGVPRPLVTTREHGNAGHNAPR
ncbi:MAG: hypothetical protein U9Q82_07070, partial [Chloroflexota bacterium]|nr:hypothetical protein [Chloroflexota bacterium]